MKDSLKKRLLSALLAAAMLSTVAPTFVTQNAAAIGVMEAITITKTETTASNWKLNVHLTEDNKGYIAKPECGLEWAVYGQGLVIALGETELKGVADQCSNFTDVRDFADPGPLVTGNSTVVTGGNKEWDFTVDVAAAIEASSFTLEDFPAGEYALITTVGGEGYGTFSGQACYETFTVDETGSTPAAEETELTGTVAIAGEAKVGSVLTASVEGGPEAAEFIYAWNGAATEKNAATYTPVLEDVGKVLTCTVTATGYAGSLTAKTAAVAAKYTKLDLAAAIDAATAKKDAVPTSTDGADVSVWDKWIAAADLQTFVNAITAAQAIVENADAKAAEIVTGYETLAAASTTFDTACKAGTKAPIVVEVPKVGDEAKPGEVVFKNADGEAISDWTKIKPSDLVVLQATPKDGFYFIKWVNKSVAGTDTPSVDAYSVDGTAKEYTTNPLTLSASEAIELQAVFGSSADISVATGEPSVAGLIPTLTTKNAERGGKEPVLVAPDGTEGFKTGIKNYDLYLLSGETGLSLQPMFNSALYNLTIGGTAAELKDVKVPNVGKPVAVTVEDGKPINIVVTEQNGTTPKSTTYVVTPHIATADPKIHIELEQDKENSTLVTATVNLSEAQVKSGQFTVKLDTAPQEGVDKFKGFSTKDGTALTADTTLEANTHYTLSASDLIVADAKYTLADSALTISLQAKGNGIAAYDKETAVLKFYLVKNDAAHKLDDVATSLTVDAAENKQNTLFDARYKGLRDDGKNAQKTSLVYITAKTAVTFYQYLQAASGSDLTNHPITFDVYMYDAETGEVGMQLNEKPQALNNPALGELKYELNAGTYQINLMRGGYLTAKVIVTSDPSDSDVAVLDGFTMVAGDLDGDGKIDTDDRARLLTVYNKTATNGAVGADADAVYADFDDDGKVNAVDLGRLLQNYTK